MKRISLFLLAVLIVTGLSAKKQMIVKPDSIVEKRIEIHKDFGQSMKDSMLMAKLNPEQLMDLERERMDVERKRIEAENSVEMPMGSVSIVLICLLPFLFTGIVIFLNVKAKNQESKRKYDLYTKSLEMGQTIPENFFDEPKKQTNPSSNLKKGVLWLAVGLAISLYFLIVKNYEPLIVGILPAFVGVGYLLVHFLEKPKPSSNDEQHG